MTSTRRTLFGRDPVVHLVVKHWILGALTGIGCAFALILVDADGLRGLLQRSDFFWIGLLLLCSGFAVTFGGIVSAAAIMILPARAEGEPD